MAKYLFTSESVTEGHPDKVCDMISDGILDAILLQDKNARVACETMITKGMVVVSAEITSTAVLDYDTVIRNIIKDIGYTNYDIQGEEDQSEKFKVLTSIKEQSPHIAQGVNVSENREQGAGDQGLMFGYACNETPELMPLPITISHALTKELTRVRKSGELDWLKPDGKSQVTVEYDENNIPVKINKVVIATQHKDMLNRFESEKSEYDFIKSAVIKKVIIPVLERYNIDYSQDFIVNGTGRFVEGGPVADVGLTGRKIIVDTYGGYAKHGGGAFSGKDPSKVDRSAAYMSRYIAKNVVASQIADKCEVQLSYCIGVAEPMSININTFETGKIRDDEIVMIVQSIFDLKPASIIEKLNLKSPIYQRYASYGHFGREDDCSWEKLDMVDKIKNKLGEYEIV